MLAYKRNQIEEALAVFFIRPSGEIIPEFSSRFRRLLDADRAMGRKARSADPAWSNYAFFSEEPPGKGVEIRFAAYDAFALLLGLRLLDHGWPQRFVIGLLRRNRTELESNHRRILGLDPNRLSDPKSTNASAHPGDIYVDNAAPVFLVIGSSDEGKNDQVQVAMCEGQEAMFEAMKNPSASFFSIYELVTPAHQLSAQLNRAAPRSRGRQK